MRLPIVIQLHAYAQQQASRSGLVLDGIVLSNGTLLTHEMVEAIQSSQLRLMISLDGLNEYHDCQRSFANGLGSFAHVTRAVDLAIGRGLLPNISITISGRNADGLPELIAWVLERDLPFSLNFYRENHLSLTQRDLSLDDEHIITAMLNAYRIIERNLPTRSLLTSLVDRANLASPHFRTCGAGNNYLVFDHAGQVAKCQMDFGVKVTNIHDPDPLSTLVNSSLGIQDIRVDEKRVCSECEWRYWCTGGCPLMTYRATGHYNMQSPNCHIYKALYPEAMRLEGLRLLAHAPRFQ